MINKRLFQLCLSVSMGLLAGVQANPVAAINSTQLPTSPVVQDPAVPQQIFSLAQTLTGTVAGTRNLGANFGSAVAVNGDYLFVASANAAPNGVSNAGILSIYKKGETGNYVLSQAITSLLGQDDLLGSIGAIQSDGEWLFVTVGSAPFASQDGPEARGGGLVQVYKLKKVDGVKTWIPHSQLHPQDLSIGDNFGARIALDAKAGWAFIAAANQTQVTTDGEEALGGGAVYAYRYDSSSKQWLPAPKITKPDGYKAVDTHFGISVAVQGAYALIGSDNGNTSGNTGSVYSYTFISGRWVNNQIFQGDQPALLDPVAQGDGFGTSVAIDGDWAVVSAPLDSTLAETAGKIYFFKAKTTTGVKTWSKVNAVFPNLANKAGFLGAKVVIKGRNAFVSTLNRSDVDNRTYGGGVHLFQRSGDVWNHAETFGGGNSYSFAGADFAYSPSRDIIAVGSFSNLDYYLPQLPSARNFANSTVTASPSEVKIFKAVSE